MGDERSDRERFQRLDAAFRAGDLDALRRESGDVDGFPNVVPHPAIGACLGYAIYHAPVALVRALLDAGADPNWPTHDGFPPLIAALSCAVPAPGATVRTDVHELLALLLAAGARVDQRDVNDYTALHVAAAQGDLAAVDMFLAAGADPDEITRIDDYETALEVAERAGRDEVVARLAPLTTRPAWERAAEAGAVAELARLAAAGHDVDARDGYGQTALMRAAHAGRVEAVKWLVAHGADLDHTAKFGLSALMLAVVGGHQQVARVLVSAGADVTKRGTGAPQFEGRTAADLADARGEPRLARLIREPGRR